MLTRRVVGKETLRDMGGAEVLAKLDQERIPGVDRRDVGDSL